MFMDGHTSHINIAVSEFCNDNNIILFCFPLPASYIILQPLDVAVYGLLKKYCDQSLSAFHKQYKCLTLSKTHLFSVFDRAGKKAVNTPENIKSGFRKCGLLHFKKFRCCGLFQIVPSNPPNASAKSSSSNQEKIAMFRAFQTIDAALPTYRNENSFRNCSKMIITLKMKLIDGFSIK